MQVSRIKRISKINRDACVTAAYNVIDSLSGDWKLSKDLKSLVETSDVDENGFASDYGMLYFTVDSEIVAFPDFMVGEGVVLLGSLGNSYTLDYETPVAA